MKQFLAKNIKCAKIYESEKFDHLHLLKDETVASILKKFQLPIGKNNIRKLTSYFVKEFQDSLHFLKV